MKKDLASKIHYGVYKKSDDLNAVENQNKDFQDGYKVGGKIKESGSIIKREWIRRGKPDFFHPDYSSFQEWKRGMWAALLRKTIGGAI